MLAQTVVSPTPRPLMGVRPNGFACWAAAVALALTVPAFAFAAPITLVSVSRQVHAEYTWHSDTSYGNDSGWYSDEDWSSAPGAFSSDLVVEGGGWEGTTVVARAQMDSYLGGYMMTASGLADGETDYRSGAGGVGECCEWWVEEGAYSTGSIAVRVTFDVLATTAFDLDVQGDAVLNSDGTGGRFTLQTDSAMIYDASWEGSSVLSETHLDLSDSGILEPGRYYLRLTATSREDGPVHYAMSFAVPEPGTALLLGGGLGLMAFARRRQRLLACR